jgi:hypothetical protein
MAWKKTITALGEELIAAALGGDIVYTRAACGSQSVPDEDLADQTDVSGEFRAASITGPIARGRVSKLTVQVNNIGLEQDTPLAQVGVYASVDGGAETLMLIMQNDTPSTLPALVTSQLAPDTTVTTIEFFIGIRIDSAGNITLTLDMSAYVTVAQLAEELANIANIVLSSDGDPPPNTRMFLHIAKDITQLYTPPNWPDETNPTDPDAPDVAPAVFNTNGTLGDGIAQNGDGSTTPMQFQN